jgi:hypothetical protein
MLINELLTSPPITRSQLETYQMFKFFNGNFLLEPGGINDQIFSDIVTLRRVAFIYSIIETILDMREKRTEQNSELEKLAQQLAAAGVA